MQPLATLTTFRTHVHKGNSGANILTVEWEFPAGFRWLLYVTLCNGDFFFLPALHSVISLFMLAKVENKHKFHFAACSSALLASLPFYIFLYFFFVMKIANS